MQDQNVDADYLLKLARSKSVESRRELSEIIVDLFENRSDILTDRERHMMFDIMRSLVHDVEVSVRKSFVLMVQALPDAPVSLVRDLASDEIDVAYPLLTQSNLLRDEDLIDIIRARTREHQLAITLRGEIDANVSDALVEMADEGVIENLLHNQNARISEATMDYLVEQSQRFDSFQGPLLNRNDLGENLAQRMFMWVSAALRKHIVDRYELDTETVDALLEKAAQEGYEEERRDSPKSKKLVAAMRDGGAIRPNTLIAALTDGEIALFVSLFAELSGVNENLVKRIVFEDGGEGLAITCKATHMTEMQFSLIFRLSRKARPNERSAFVGHDIHALLELYRKMSQEVAMKVVHRWQRGSDYLAAIRDLEHDD